MQQQVEEVLAHYFDRVDRGLPVDRNELIRAHPELADELRAFFDNLSVLSDLIDQATPSESEAATQAAPRSVPKSIGRYEVQTVLGEGGFGRVFLAYDEQLERHVAIKVPHADLVKHEERRERFVAEGRNLARLSHPNLLSVFDAGVDEAGQCFTVTEYIEGQTLYQVIAEGRPTVSEALDILVQIVDGLEAAHQAGIVHRDLKPSNILVNDDGRVAIADFGLAVRDEQQWEQRGQLAGTRPYMAPEQLRGENHRLDPRTDIWALGVVAYELLTGQRPFPGRKAAELLRAIEQDEIASVRAFNRSIPTMLERICHRCLQERMVDRYPSAAELASELKQLQARGLPQTSDASQAVFDEVAHQLTPPGVRSFESADAEAYVLLVPGLRDVNGVPELVRSWVTKLDCRVTKNTSPIGIVYGPSGSGKSSFVKAGVVPRLRSETHVLTMEATKDDTSNRLRVGLERLVPQAIQGADWDDLPLPQLLAQLRRWCHARDEKIVLVMDQIEQWFSTWDGDAAHPLVTALRQCDGVALQAVMVVRDDFWLAMSRFMAALEQSVVDGENAQLIDLLTPKHAINVLRGLGRAYRALPPHPQPLSPTQSKFLEDAVEELAANRKVAPVQLALLAQMLQHETWDTRLLEKLGGIRGIGVRFFEQTFSSEQTPTFYRDHLPAIQAVLRMLLPLQHSDSPAHIKGASCSLQTLREASGCGSDEPAFQELMRILERDTRLVTPVDPMRDEDSDNKDPHFQLAHDYLVESLREWLDRTDALTRRGRTRQLLRRLSETWSTHEDPRHLPGFLEWIQIRTMVPRTEWSSSQGRMLQQARQRILRQVALLACIGAIAVATVWTAVGNLRTQNFVDTWLHGPAAELVVGMDQIKKQRGRATRIFKRILADSEASNQPILARRARMGLAVLTPGYETSLLQQLPEIPVDELPALIMALSRTPNDQLDLESLWSKLQSNDTTAGEFLTTAVFLANRTPDEGQWTSVVTDLAALLHQNPNAHDYLELLRGIAPHLLPEVAELVATSSDGVRLRHPVQIYEKVAGVDRDLGPLLHRFEATLDPQGDRPINQAKQTAAVATALAMLGHWEPVSQVFSSVANPTMTSHLLRFLTEPNLQIDSLVEQLSVTADAQVVRGFTLAVGKMGKTLPTRSREQLVRAMVEAGIRNPTHGVLHAGSWTLRNLEMDLEQLPVQLTKEWVSRKPLQWRRIALVDGTIAAIDELPLSTLQKSRQLESPMVCCPPGEIQRLDDLQRPLKLIATRPYALGTTEVTVEEYLRFRNDHKWGSRTAPSFDCPINKVTWYDAVAYCQWLNEQCNIPEEHWCYLPNAKGEFAEGMTIPEDALERQGFRLPTVAEWELAARAEAKTTWHFGNDPSVTQEYAWFNANAGLTSHAVGQLKPNALGLFDMHGNVWEWCHDEFEKEQEATDGDETEQHRRLCGGTHLDPPVDLRFTMTHGNPITKDTDADGFRICRTLPSD